jgi:hypothetical protein
MHEENHADHHEGHGARVQRFHRNPPSRSRARAVLHAPTVSGVASIAAVTRS